jgi:hypothetical protein
MASVPETTANHQVPLDSSARLDPARAEVQQSTKRRVWSLIRDPYWTPWLCSLVVLCLGVAWVLVAIYDLVQIEVRHD